MPIEAAKDIDTTIENAIIIAKLVIKNGHVEIIPSDRLDYLVYKAKDGLYKIWARNGGINPNPPDAAEVPRVTLRLVENA
jgi:hypothetical protein